MGAISRDPWGPVLQRVSRNAIPRCMRNIVAVARHSRVSSIWVIHSYGRGGKPWVFNLGTQEHYWRIRASYEAIEASLKKMKRQADEESIRMVAIPQIGTGYGRLSWKKVRTIIARIFDDWAGMLYVYEKYVPGNTGKINRVIPN